MPCPRATAVDSNDFPQHPRSRLFLGRLTRCSSVHTFHGRWTLRWRQRRCGGHSHAGEATKMQQSAMGFDQITHCDGFPAGRVFCTLPAAVGRATNAVPLPSPPLASHCLQPHRVDLASLAALLPLPLLPPPLLPAHGAAAPTARPQPVALPAAPPPPPLAVLLMRPPLHVPSSVGTRSPPPPLPAPEPSPAGLIRPAHQTKSTQRGRLKEKEQIKRTYVCKGKGMRRDRSLQAPRFSACASSPLAAALLPSPPSAAAPPTAAAL